MNAPRDKHGETEFERTARAMFDASIDSLDARTLSRLNQARHRALDAAAASRSRRRLWLMWAPAGALAAGVFAAALLLRGPIDDPTVAAETQAPVELLAAGEDLDIAAEADLEFYAWAEVADDATSSGFGG